VATIRERRRPVSFPELLGIEWLSSEWDRARIEVSDRLRQPYGLVHGGVYSSLAETVASWATDQAVTGDGKIAVGQALQITFLRPITQGHVNATGRAIHRGRRTWVWDLDITDDDDRLCAVVRMTVAVRERRE
jgi:1,4-dihydroxy-2-naphthoyl-CoA hydrolase